MDWSEYLKLLAGLIVVVDPVGAIPIFIGLTENRSVEERRRSAWICAVAVGIVLAIALISGESVLRLFGIRMPAFQVAGGVLILLMGISMLRVTHDRARQTPEERIESADKDSIAVVPMAIPLLSGPSAISTVIVYANLERSWVHFLHLALIIITVSVTVLAALLAAPKIATLLSRTGLNIITRVMGLIITAIAIEFIARGVTDLFPVLAHR